MSDVPDYVKVSSFAMQFEGDAELPGQMIDVFLRKHYTTLELSELKSYFPQWSEQDLEEVVEEFVENDLVLEQDGEYTVNNDNPIVQGLREEQTDMLGEE